MVPDHGTTAEFGFTDNLDNVHPIYAKLVPTKQDTRHEPRCRADQSRQRDRDALWKLQPNEMGAGALRWRCSQIRQIALGRHWLRISMQTSGRKPGPINADGEPALSDPRWASSSSESPPVTGCNKLRFSLESFSFQPDTSTTHRSTWMSFDLRIPQKEEPSALATPPLKDATVTLPAGVIVNPSAAGGLASCSIGQIGWLGGTLTTSPLVRRHVPTLRRSAASR
jgi:hypothetical protein